MKFKEFIKLSWIKVIFLIIFFLITIFVPKYGQQCNMFPDGEIHCKLSEIKGIGYPIFWGENYSSDVITTGFNPLNFIINLIIFYFLSCIIIFIYNKIKGK